MDYSAGSRRRILPGSGYYSGPWMKAEALNSSCHSAPGGVNGCHFVTVNPRAHMRAHVTAGIPFHAWPLSRHRRHQSLAAVAGRLISAGPTPAAGDVFFFPPSSTTTAINGVNWAQ